MGGGLASATTAIQRAIIFDSFLKQKRSGPWNPGLQSSVTFSPVRAAQAAKTCFALTGLISYVILTQGSGRSAAFTLGCAAARFQRLKNLT
jgi:hypothetical protein